MAESTKKTKKRIIIIPAVVLLASISGLVVYVAWTSYNDTPKNLESPSYGFDIGTTDEETFSAMIPEDTLYPSLDSTYDEIEDRKEEETEGESPPVNETPPAPDANTNIYAYPDTILSCTRSGDDLLILVNKQYQLPASYAPADLTAIENSGIRVTKSGMLIRNIIVSDLTAMITTAAGQGIDIAALSAYRSYGTQQITYNYWVNYNGGNTDAADMVSARPGHSQHQLGTAVDFTSNEISDQLGQHFGGTIAGKWLAEHAWEYGFALAYPSGWEAETGYSFEPWHFRYIGKGNAAEWHTSGQILEVWLRGKN